MGGLRQPCVSARGPNADPAWLPRATLVLLALQDLQGKMEKGYVSCSVWATPAARLLGENCTRCWQQ